KEDPMARENRTAGTQAERCPKVFRAVIRTLLQVDDEMHRRIDDSMRERSRRREVIKMLADWVRAQITSSGRDASAAQRFLQLPDKDQLWYVGECGAALMNMPDCPECSEWMIENCTDCPPGCTHGRSVLGPESQPDPLEDFPSEGVADWD
ncbi:hypothetical protein ACFL5Q_04650, partial [Planctomycetota bacterium]